MRWLGCVQLPTKEFMSLDTHQSVYRERLLEHLLRVVPASKFLSIPNIEAWYEALFGKLPSATEE